MLQDLQDAEVKASERLEAETATKVREVGMIGTDVLVVLSKIESLKVICTLFESMAVDGTFSAMKISKFKRVYHTMCLLVPFDKVYQCANFRLEKKR